MDFREWLQLWERNYVDGQPFLDSLDALIYIRDKHPDPKNLVVTFTAVDKVGINPQSPHDTPLGIYFYTIEYVIRKKQKVPFAGEQPFIQVCELTRPDKVLQMNAGLTSTGADGIDMLYGIFNKKDVDAAVERFGFDRMVSYSTLWEATKVLCLPGARSNLELSTRMNKAFRDMGVSGFIDNGTGTIFAAEPYQGVVFRASDLRLIHTLENTERRYKRMPSYTRSGDYEIGSGIYSNAESFYRDFYRASTDKAKSDLLDKKYLAQRLIDSAANKKHMTDIILKHKTKWSSEDVAAMMSRQATDRIGLRLMAMALGEEKLAKINAEDLTKLMTYAKDKREMADVVGRENLDKLQSEDVRILLSNSPKGQGLIDMAEVLAPRHMDKLTPLDLADLIKKRELWYGDADKILELLTPTRIAKLDGAEHFGVNLVDYIADSAKDSKKMRELLVKHMGRMQGSRG